MAKEKKVREANASKNEKKVKLNWSEPESITWSEEPSNNIEVTLMKILLQSTDFAKIGVNDDFFDLGIDSLAAVDVMVEVEKQFNKRLPLSTLIKYPTIRKLALFIQGELEDDFAYKSLVVLKAGGNAPPLYIVHGIGLNLLNLYNMVSNLDDDQPVYGLQSIGLDGTMQLPDTIEEVARFYISEITQHDASGPYAIAGYSFGGVIAFEMVRQLEQMGKEVKLLVMFDTNIQYPSHRYPLLKKITVKGIRQFKKLFFRLPFSPNLYQLLNI